ncbi:MAG: chorismate mutase, partial [Eubacterium sp.]|nr:chorismate mutase [Eubacterium sp.]
MSTRAVRGATTVKENTREAILSETGFLLKEMMEKNSLKNEDIISIM